MVLIQEEADDPYPEGDKIKIDPHPVGGKGDLLIQGMIHRGKGNPPRQEGGPVLTEEEIIENRSYTAYSPAAEQGIGEDLNTYGVKRTVRHRPV
jgi:hypothetical protein